MFAPHSPLTAYRLDIARRPNGEPFTDADDGWLSLALRTERAAAAAADRSGDTLRELEQAAGLKDEVADLDQLFEQLQQAAEQMESHGALHLAHSTLVATRRLAEPAHPLAAGRTLAIEARIAWKRGDLAVSETLYRELGQRARQARLPELRIRHLLGLGVVAQLRGNYPAVRQYARSAIRLAVREQRGELAAIGHQLLMRAAAAAGTPSEAVVHGWRAFTIATGNPQREVEMLLNLSQLMFELGELAAASGGFRAVLQRDPSARIRFPALGGLAMASAAQGADTLARDTVTRILEEGASTPFPYQAASALVDAATAARIMGDAQLADRVHAASTVLVERYGYHELDYRLTSLRTRAEPAPAARLALTAERIVSSFECLPDTGLVTESARPGPSSLCSTSCPGETPSCPGEASGPGGAPRRAVRR